VQLVLIRHGRSVMNDLGRIQGQTCAGLSAIGKEQAELIASHLSQRLTGPVRIVASDLVRAMDTARPLADRLGIDVQPDSRFRERSCGRWEQAGPKELEHAEQALWARWQAGDDVLPEVGGGSLRRSWSHGSSRRLRRSWPPLWTTPPLFWCPTAARAGTGHTPCSATRRGCSPGPATPPSPPSTNAGIGGVCGHGTRSRSSALDLVERAGLRSA
jgi:hypothetical protein